MRRFREICTIPGHLVLKLNTDLFMIMMKHPKNFDVELRYNHIFAKPLVSNILKLSNVRCFEGSGAKPPGSIDCLKNKNISKSYLRYFSYSLLSGGGELLLMIAGTRCSLNSLEGNYGEFYFDLIFCGCDIFDSSRKIGLLTLCY